MVSLLRKSMKTGSELKIPSKISLLKGLAGMFWRGLILAGCALRRNCQRAEKAIAVIKQLMKLSLC
jgi:hypothetical protein